MTGFTVWLEIRMIVMIKYLHDLVVIDTLPGRWRVVATQPKRSWAVASEIFLSDLRRT